MLRTLLVDNYDSFSYNLFHYLAEVNGDEPDVVRNDAALPDVTRYDNVVISPGPGTPERPADFGICARIIKDALRPILGVCLGHQGIAHAFGASVVRATEPRHGRVSAVHHRGRGIFSGIPSPFDVVRYHSLVVEDLPEEIEAIAWTADDVVMGLRHRSRPLWGVQFHPESIKTEHGHQLLRNFSDLTRAWQSSNDVASASRRTTSHPLRRSAPARHRYRVTVETLPTEWDAEVAFDTLFRGQESAFWLDSGDQGRFSVMGDGTGPLARTVTAEVSSGTVTVTSQVSTERIESGFFDWLDADLRDVEVEVPELPIEFALGWVGYLGYELKAECGGSAAHESTEPDACLAFVDRALVLDHETGQTHLLALVDEGWFAATKTALRGIAGKNPPAVPAGPGVVGLELRAERDAYLKQIAACQSEIAAGETYEINLTNMITARGQFDAWQCYRRMRHLSPAPFGALLTAGDVSVLSTSPERFLHIDRHGRVESKPVKGTRPRGSTRERDSALEEDLRDSEKDRAENLIIVDLIRNDVGRRAAVGSVAVPEIFAVESYASVHQLVSTVTARLRPEASAVEAVRAAFPGGSMTGAPKIRTMEIIDRLEGAARGVYSGAIGYFSLTGAVDLSIVIRTAVVTADRIDYGVGGAIVALSEPLAEFEETAVKAEPLLNLLGSEFPGRR